MKLTIYLLRKFIGVFIGALFLFAYAMVILDTINNISSYITNKAPIKDILRICTMLTPKALCMFAPLAALFSAAYVLSDMYAKNELISILVGGLSLYRFTLPLVALGGLLTVGFFYFEDRVAVNAYSAATELQKHYVNKKEDKDKADRSQLVILSQGAKVVYNAIAFNARDNVLYDVLIVFRSKDKELEALSYAQAAMWDEGKGLWVLDEPTVYIFSKGRLSISESLPYEYQKLLTELPSTFRNNVTDIEAVNIATAREHIAYLKRAGLPYTKESTDYYRKFSSPCAIFITVLLAIGLSGKTKYNVLLVTLAYCIGTTAVYYIMQMIVTLLAQFGYIRPILGAWLPVGFTVLCSLEVLRHVRT